jgi:hypothetical protein
MAPPVSEPVVAPSGPTRFHVPESDDPSCDKVSVAGLDPVARLFVIVPFQVPENEAGDGAAGDEPPQATVRQITPPRIIRRTPNLQMGKGE